MSDEEFFYPNRWGRGVLTSGEEIIGKKGMAALLNLAGLPELINNYPPDDMKKEFPFTSVSKIQQAFWDMYGSGGAQVFATRAGEATFNAALNQFGSVAKAAQLAMSAGSPEARIKIGLEFFAKFFNTVSDQKVRIEDDDDYWYWVIERCPMCWNRTANEPLGHLGVGVLKAAAAWANGGETFRIQEHKCIAMGDKEGSMRIEKPKKKQA
jgi:predicted hydrocarbon binding protein